MYAGEPVYTKQMGGKHDVQTESYLSRQTANIEMFFGTSGGCEDALGITLPGSKGHQDSTLSQQKETENITHMI